MKVPAPRRLKNGKWYIYMRLGGQAYPVTDASKADCVARARSIKAQYKAGELDTQPPTKAAPATLGAVIDAYIDKYAPVLSPATVRGYQTVRRCRFVGYMEREIGKIDYQAMVNAETAAVSPKTVKNAWGVVGAALKWAGVEVPPVKLPPVPVKEIPFLQPEEIGPFLEAIEGDGAELLLLLELHGLRYSEARALTWADIDLAKKTMYVHSAVVPGPDHRFTHKSTTKNRTSSRTVPIMIPRLLAVLEGAESRDGPLVTIHPLTGRKAAHRAAERAGVTVVGNHGLRHSFASLCYHLGLPERQIMELGGWSNTATMHKIYIRVTNRDREAAVKAVSDFFGTQNAHQNANQLQAP